MAKTNGEHTETCGRCGYPKAQHVVLTRADDVLAPSAYVCPTALFLKDELHGLMDDK